MKVITNLITILFLEVPITQFPLRSIKVHGDNKGMAPVLFNSALDTDNRSASRSNHVFTSK